MRPIATITERLDDDALRGVADGIAALGCGASAKNWRLVCKRTYESLAPVRIRLPASDVTTFASFLPKMRHQLSRVARLEIFGAESSRDLRALGDAMPDARACFPMLGHVECDAVDPSDEDDAERVGQALGDIASALSPSADGILRIKVASKAHHLGPRTINAFVRRVPPNLVKRLDISCDEEDPEDDSGAQFDLSGLAGLESLTFGNDLWFGEYGLTVPCTLTSLTVPWNGSRDRLLKALERAPDLRHLCLIDGFEEERAHVARSLIVMKRFLPAIERIEARGRIVLLKNDDWYALAAVEDVLAWDEADMSLLMLSPPPPSSTHIVMRRPERLRVSWDHDTRDLTWEQTNDQLVTPMMEGLRRAFPDLKHLNLAHDEISTDPIILGDDDEYDVDVASLLRNELDGFLLRRPPPEATTSSSAATDDMWLSGGSLSVGFTSASLAAMTHCAGVRKLSLTAFKRGPPPDIWRTLLQPFTQLRELRLSGSDAMLDVLLVAALDNQLQLVTSLTVIGSRGGWKPTSAVVAALPSLRKLVWDETVPAPKQVPTGVEMVFV